MDGISRSVLVAMACVLSLVSGLAGGLLALALDDPDVVVTERVIEVAPTERPPGASLEDLEQLRLTYVATTGANEDWALGLVDEIWADVCLDDASAAELLAGVLGPDITMEPADLEAFVEQVRLVCP